MSRDVSLSLELAYKVEIMLHKVGATRENFWIPLSQNEDLAKQALEIINAKPYLVDSSCLLDQTINDVSLGLIHEAEVTLRKVGATRKNFWEPLSQNEGLAKQVLEVVDAKLSYPVVVDYNCSLDEMIKAGNYGYVNPRITASNFPIQGEGKREVEVVLFSFNRRIIRSEEIIIEVKKRGYRPARIEELLALSEKYPDLQQRFPIVALGSVWYDDYDVVPVVCRGNGQCRLGLSIYACNWNQNYSFATVAC